MTRARNRICIAELRRLAATGMSRTAAAKVLGCSTAGVRYVTEQHGIKWAVVPPGRPRNEEPAPAPEATPLERMKALAAQENARLRRVLEAHA